MGDWNDYAKSETGIDAEAIHASVIARFPPGWEYGAPVIRGARGCLIRKRDFKHLLAARNPEAWPFQIEELETSERELAHSFARFIEDHHLQVPIDPLFGLVSTDPGPKPLSPLKEEASA